MTLKDFVSICEHHAVLPSVAVQNEEVKALLKRDMGKNSIINQLNMNALLARVF